MATDIAANVFAANWRCHHDAVAVGHLLAGWCVELSIHSHPLTCRAFVGCVELSIHSLRNPRPTRQDEHAHGLPGPPEPALGQRPSRGCPRQAGCVLPSRGHPSELAVPRLPPMCSPRCAAVRRPEEQRLVHGLPGVQPLASGSRRHPRGHLVHVPVCIRSRDWRGGCRHRGLPPRQLPSAPSGIRFKPSTCVERRQAPVLCPELAPPRRRRCRRSHLPSS